MQTKRDTLPIELPKYKYPKNTITSKTIIAIKPAMVTPRLERREAIIPITTIPNIEIKAPLNKCSLYIIEIEKVITPIKIPIIGSNRIEPTIIPSVFSSIPSDILMYLPYIIETVPSAIKNPIIVSFVTKSKIIESNKIMITVNKVYLLFTNFR